RRQRDLRLSRCAARLPLRRAGQLQRGERQDRLATDHGLPEEAPEEIGRALLLRRRNGKPGRICPARLLLLALLVVFAPASVHAQDYPARPIRLIITTPAGGLVDVMGRLFADELSARLGQPVVIDNRVGGMTQIGADALNRATPDGYMLMI